MAAILPKSRVGVFWFSNDLRITDNAALNYAAQSCETLLCVYILDPRLYAPNRYGLRSMGPMRDRFLQESLAQLSVDLNAVGQTLLVLRESPLQAMAQLIGKYDPGLVVRSRHAGFYECKHWAMLQRRYRLISFNAIATHTLFNDENLLPFPLTDLPKTFSQFRKKVEPLADNRNLLPVCDLPPPPRELDRGQTFTWALLKNQSRSIFKGGAEAGVQQLQGYFHTTAPSEYKTVRNALDGWGNSTKLSPWLANGCLSVNQVLLALGEYEAQYSANESTYWIGFELLWREYFQWSAYLHGARLFARDGINGSKKLNTFYSQRFMQWCEGGTPFPLVNALMKQLNATGYMSNRGRQIAASCLVNELALDWRYGAAYFEQQLIDYDVASNWGNWQYIAGVGADPRGGRHFNLDKQREIYDPEGDFIAKWGGESATAGVNSVDAADWPLADERGRPPE
ncbi:DASH family cryptochrome [Teredinibacter turnerae]|uniref:DASH family cryptochrome n=1 Tax=Teredinibacter turnerae TaxID=2426 RepID=UPI000476DDCE|nr:DASH family cryptochrome [Teredinibacter turnerae]